jgi:hypothetical protein
MNPAVIMTCGLFVLAVAAGMLGLGVAFSAVPFLDLYERQCYTARDITHPACSRPEVMCENLFSRKIITGRAWDRVFEERTGAGIRSVTMMVTAL